MKINVDNLSFSYKETDALERVCFSLSKGEITAIIGPNGSGKSTLLKCLDRILRYRKGSVEVDGVNLLSLSSDSLSRKIAYVPQREQYLMPIKVFDAVMLGRKPHIKWGITDEDISIVSEMLERLDLTHYAMRSVQALSGGQQQRVALARALCQQPEILLLDEPTANLDLYQQTRIMEYLTDLAHEGIVVVITLHDINLAIQYCHRALMLESGKLFANGGREVFTSENISKLFHTEVDLLESGNHVFVVPKRSKRENK